MFVAEDPYGTLKRFEFCRAAIRALSPTTVLDIGCGTGSQLTRPLAEAFPDTKFAGVDPDRASIEFARQERPPENLRFGDPELAAQLSPVDLVIASEVVEHVEDPADFLASLRSMLRENGRVIVTLPNGYGPFEAATTIEAILKVLGVYDAMRRAKRHLLRQPPPPAHARGADSLAVSPHLSFFSYGRITALFRQAGLAVVRYEPRTLACGFAIDKVIMRFGLADWNARVANRFPPWCCSAWMFELVAAEPVAGPPYRRGLVARLRRRLNEACAGQG